jgi:hypothetical protein
MFLSSMSTAQERKARKGGGGPKKTKNEDNSDIDDLLKEFSVSDKSDKSNTAIIAKLQPKGSLSILYNQDTISTNRDGNTEASTTTSMPGNTYPIPREIMMSFFNEAISMMNNDQHIEGIIDGCWGTEIPLHQAAMEFQRDVMEYNHRIERNYGCKCLSLIPKSSPDDKVLHDAAVSFMFASQQCYVAALKKRSKRYGTKKRATGKP